MPVPESDYVCCKDCKRGPKFEQFNKKDACSSGWKAKSRRLGCYVGKRIDGTKAKKGEQGYVG